MFNHLFLLLGGNTGNIAGNFSFSIRDIETEIGKLISASPVYMSEPWGFHSKDLFLNQVLQVETTLSPEDILKKILFIERKLGRIRSGKKYSSRTIDIDILFLGDKIINTPDLTIPHPRLHLRRFTLVPLNDIAPGFIHPLLKKSVSQLLLECEDSLDVKPCNR
jgi:2-amino-4-hydroxy-6-hydroxymethyldihydropteridine diphosphokinase